MIGTDAKMVKCRKCGVGRELITVQSGQWCGTCGYNPSHLVEIEVQNAKITLLNKEVSDWRARAEKAEQVLQSGTLVEVEGVQLIILPMWPNGKPGEKPETPE